MGELMKRIFGKENNITFNDLESNLLGKRENEILEAKSLKNIKNSDQLYKLVTEPLVGFLNKINKEGGLLILGVEAKNNKIDDINDIIGVDRDLIKNLENMITDDILAYPDLKSKYKYEIEAIPVKDNKFVYLLEIHNDESGIYTYYSRHNNEGYIRNAYSTNKISIPDFIKIVKERSSPKVKISINCGLKMKNPNSTEKVVIADFSYINEGHKIGKYIVSTIEIYMEYREGMNIPDIPVDRTFMDIPEPSMQKLDNNPKYIMVKKLQVNLNQFNISVSYPTVPIQIGKIYFNQTLFDDERKVIITAITYEETSKIEQKFALTFPSEDNNITPSCTSLGEIFTPY